MHAKCSSLQMLKVIRRQLSAEDDDLLPEQNFVLAIIGNAITDLRSKSFRLGAMMFFDSELFHIYCDLIGLRPDATRQLLVRGGFLHS